MVDVYSKMNTDSFTSQLQTTLTAYYEDIKGGCPKPKVVKRKFEDQEDAGLAQKAAPASAADTDPMTPRTTPPLSPRRTGGRQPPPRMRLAPSRALQGSLAGGRQRLLLPAASLASQEP